MDWIEVTIFTSTAGIDPVVGVLEDLGIEGYALEDAADFEEFLQDTEIYWDYVDEKLCEELRGQETKIKVYIADSDEGHAQIDTLNARLAELKAQDADDALGRLTTAQAVTRQEDWEWGWKQYFKPFPVGEQFLIKPSWRPWTIRARAASWRSTRPHLLVRARMTPPRCASLCWKRPSKAEKNCSIWARDRVSWPSRPACWGQTRTPRWISTHTA